MAEQAAQIICQQKTLIGVLHVAESQVQPVGVLVVVGGPQTRVGSHRQFVLLARQLAAQGYHCLRFDYRGMGDSAGDQRDFEAVHEDIKAALDYFQQQTGIKRFVLWGLCDAASANLFYAYQDNRIKGLVLLNPWVRTESGEAQTYLKHYYLQRLTSRDFWTKILKGKFNVKQSFGSFLQIIKRARENSVPQAATPSQQLTGNLPQRMEQAWGYFSGPILLILSGQDLTAAEFKDVVKATPSWQSLVNSPHVQTEELNLANHTFAKREWRDQVARWTVNWLRAIVNKNI